MPEKPDQLYFVQWLRVILTGLVVAHHAGQPYGPTGGEWPIDDPASNEYLGAFFSLNASFFMGFFFLLAGYFVEGSYDRKGAGAFVRARLLRLGVPLVFITVFIFGLIAYGDAKTSSGYFEFLLFEYIGRWQIEMGPLWFIAQLLMYCLLYALWRVLATKKERAVPALPGDRTIFLYALGLGLAGAAVRSVYPQDDWVRILWVIPAEPAHMPQYISMFIIGIVAGRGRWFEAFETALGHRWLLIGIATFFGLRAGINLMPDFINRQVVWDSLEGFACVGFILGLLAIGRTYLSTPSTWWRRLDGCAYGVYLFHVFILVGLQMAILGLDYPALIKFAMVTLAGLIASLATVATLRRIPYVRDVI